MKKFLILSISIFVLLISFSNAAELLLAPSNWKYAPWCIIWIDIIMDPDWAQISATDIIIESSMDFIKFEENDLFPYFLPPKITENIVHIVWFTAWPQQRIKEKWKIWKIFFKTKNISEIDWSIKFYIQKKWDTTDSNLSIWWWVDVLEDVRNWFYTFNWDECSYPNIKENYNTEEIKNTQEKDFKKLKQEINKLEQKIEKDHKASIYKKSREDNKSYIIWLFIIVVILAAYFSISKWKSKQA